MHADKLSRFEFGFFEELNKLASFGAVMRAAGTNAIKDGVNTLMRQPADAAPPPETVGAKMVGGALGAIPYVGPVLAAAKQLRGNSQSVEAPQGNLGFGSVSAYAPPVHS